MRNRPFTDLNPYVRIVFVNKVWETKKIPSKQGAYSNAFYERRDIC